MIAPLRIKATQTPTATKSYQIRHQKFQSMSKNQNWIFLSKQKRKNLKFQNCIKSKCSSWMKFLTSVKFPHSSVSIRLPSIEVWNLANPHLTKIFRIWHEGRTISYISINYSVLDIIKKLDAEPWDHVWKLIFNKPVVYEFKLCLFDQNIAIILNNFISMRRSNKLNETLVTNDAVSWVLWGGFLSLSTLYSSPTPSDFTKHHENMQILKMKF